MPSTPLPTVGVLVPSTDTTLEQELPQLLSGRATVHFTRMDLPDVTPAGLAVMEQAAHAGIGLLAQIEPDVILFGCTSGSFFRGAAHETRLVADLSSRTDAPIITTARAMVRALSARGRRVRLRTPTPRRSLPPKSPTSKTRASQSRRPPVSGSFEIGTSHGSLRPNCSSTPPDPTTPTCSCSAVRTFPLSAR